MLAIVVQDIVVVCVVVENVAVVVVGVAIRGSNAIDFGVAIVPFNIFLSVQASKQANERTNKRYCTKFIHGPARRSGGDQNSFELCILSARFKIFVPPSIESFPIHLDTKLRLAFSLCPASFAHSLATTIATHKIANAQKLFLSLLIHDRMKR